VSLPPDYEQVAWSWTEHLRHRGTTTWTEWLASACAPGTPVPAGWPVPGAAQLELVRRLATVSRLDEPAFARLADLVLARSAPGRGQGHQPLWWPGQPSGRRFGAPPVDPSVVPEEELLRVAVGSLAELALQSPADRAAGSARRLGWFARGPRIEVVGAPVTAAAVRHRLGLTPRRSRDRVTDVVVLVEPFDRLLAEVWSARVQRGAPVRWTGFVRRWSGRTELPPAADLAGLARQWADRVGAGRVHLVSTEGDRAAAIRDALGLPTRRPGAPPRLRELAPEAVDLCRRVNAVLAVRVEQERHRAALTSLVRSLATHGPGQCLTVPGRRRHWARSRAHGLADDLRSGGYRVHGDLGRLLPAFAGVTGPDTGEELAVALSGCARLAEGWAVGWTGG
jgi:hypothetical protein